MNDEINTEQPLNDEINTEQPLIMQPQCVDCRLYDGFGQCLEHGDRLRDNCENFELLKGGKQ